MTTPIPTTADAAYRLAFATAHELKIYAEQWGVEKVTFNLQHADDYFDNDIDGWHFEAPSEEAEDCFDEYLATERALIGDLIFGPLVDFSEGDLPKTTTVIISELPDLSGDEATTALQVLNSAGIGE